jgi:hypothetical protein
VQTLVTNELHGTIDWGPREGGGTQVVLDIVLRNPGRDSATSGQESRGW